MEENQITEFMNRAGFKPRHQGYKYIKQSIKAFADSNFDTRLLGLALYQTLANRDGKQAKTVEKNITCAIESAYLKGDMDYLQEMGLIFDNVRGRPTNSEFIATAAVELMLMNNKDIIKYKYQE